MRLRQPVLRLVRPVIREGFLSAMFASSLAAQQPLRDHLDASRLRVASDSFVVLLQGNPQGWQRLTMIRDGAGWQVGDAVEIASMVRQSSVVLLDERLQERSLRQQGAMGGREMEIALDFIDGRVRGRSMTPSSGPSGTLVIDTTVTPGTIDDNAVMPLLAAVRWHDGLDITFPVFSSGKGTVADYRLRVIGTETTVVPAGSFDTWRIELRLERSATIVNVTRSEPYRVVRMSNGPAFEVQLVR